MSEVENEVNPVEDFINALQQQNFNQAKSHFDSLINDKVQTRLDTEKVAMAQSIFNDQDDDIVEDDITDEEIEDEVDAAIAEFEEEEDEDTGEQEGKEIYSGAFEDDEEETS